MHADFMTNQVQLVLNEIGLRRSALNEFITALLPTLQQKIDHILPELIKNDRLLSHFVHENLAFDSALRKQYLYLPYGDKQWDGLVQHSLKSQRVFALWKNAEKECMSFRRLI